MAQLTVLLWLGCGVGLEYSGTEVIDSAGDEADADTDTDADSDADTDADVPLPERGELVLSEVLIDPAAVDDGDGEWLEIVNVSDHLLDLGSLWLADEGVDGVGIDAALTLRAGAYAVLCGNGTSADNGGVSCDATYRYKTSGGGLSMANSGDELLLMAGSGGTVIDRISWEKSFVNPGVAMGVRPGKLTEGGNDDAAAWCEQTGRLSGGDQGSPGRENGC